MMKLLLVPALVGLFASIIANKIAITVAQRLAFVDQPGAEAHKKHARAVPYGGGIAMAAALALTFIVGHLPTVKLLAIPEFSPVVVICMGAGIMFFMGMIDDKRSLPALLKLTVQIVVSAAVVYFADLSINFLAPWPLISFGLAWAWLILVTNAYNLIDHADGFSSSIGIVSIGVLLYSSLASGSIGMAWLWVALISVLCGFLCWNWPPARIYMGDAGSLPLGFFIGCGTLGVTFWPSDSSGSPLSVLAPILITAIPMFDTAVVIVKRLRAGQPIMRGDRNHIGHRLWRLGMRSSTTVATVIALQVALATGALQLRYEAWLPGLVSLIQTAAILVAVVLLETVRDSQPPPPPALEPAKPELIEAAELKL